MDENSSQRSSATVWTLWILAIPLVYVLSIGPVVRFTEDKSIPMHHAEWVTTLYLPVGWLHDHTPLKKPLERYLEWWVQ